MPTPSDETWEELERLLRIYAYEEFHDDGNDKAAIAAMEKIKAFIATVRQEGYAEGRKAAVEAVEQAIQEQAESPYGIDHEFLTAIRAALSTGNEEGEK